VKVSKHWIRVDCQGKNWIRIECHGKIWIRIEYQGKNWIWIVCQGKNWMLLTQMRDQGIVIMVMGPRLLKGTGNLLSF
jgi:hypothetical protein